ncbi:MAG: acetyl-CoA carboxylase biotin carboxyl carrier protein [Rhodocyclaceae bacterium]|nr:MAG: acetyl-CoA carboxylase biotin carboxyl carrier protein [Rhodocyclaceae bacterium]
MSNAGFSYQDLLQIVDLIKTSSRFSEFHLKVGEMELDIRRGAAAPAQQPVSDAPPAAPAEMSGSGTTVPSEPHRASAVAYPAGSLLVKSPMVGSFYRAPEPGAKPFVEVGSAVRPDTVVGIVEVMKLVNSIPASHHGVVTHILVGDGEPVQYGQVLVVIEPGPAA